MLIICFPVGMYLMWKQRKWENDTRIVITISWITYVFFEIWYYFAFVVDIKRMNYSWLFPYNPGVSPQPEKVRSYDFLSIMKYGYLRDAIIFFFCLLLIVWLYVMWRRRKLIKWRVSTCVVVTIFVLPVLLYGLMWTFFGVLYTLCIPCR